MQTLKNRKRKFALSVKIVAMLSCLAIASVGFASWLVVHDPEAQDAAGTINVATTSSAKVTLEVVMPTVEGGGTYEPQITFGRPVTSSTPISWLIPQEVEVEDLSETFTVKYTAESFPTGASLDFTLDFNGVATTDANARIATLISKGYLTLTVALGTNKVTYDKENEFPAAGAHIDATPIASANVGASGEIAVSITFAWGSKFGTKNPYDHYNAITNPDAAKIQEALDVLKEIADIVQGTGTYAGKGALTYSVVIDAKINLSGLTEDYYPSQGE